MSAPTGVVAPLEDGVLCGCRCTHTYRVALHDAPEPWVGRCAHDDLQLPALAANGKYARAWKSESQLYAASTSRRPFPKVLSGPTWPRSTAPLRSAASCTSGGRLGIALSSRASAPVTW